MKLLSKKKVYQAMIFSSLTWTLPTRGEIIEPKPHQPGGGVPEIPEFIYLRCGATSKNLDSKSRLVPGNRPDVYLLTIPIKDSKFVSGGDSCVFTASSQESGLSTDAVSFTIKGGSMKAPGSASPAFGTSKEFKIKYSSARSYIAMLALTNPPIFMVVPEDGQVDGTEGEGGISIVF